MSGGGNTNTIQEADPFSGAIPFLVGTGDVGRGGKPLAPSDGNVTGPLVSDKQNELDRQGIPTTRGSDGVLRTPSGAVVPEGPGTVFSQGKGSPPIQSEGIFPAANRIFQDNPGLSQAEIDLNDRQLGVLELHNTEGALKDRDDFIKHFTSGGMVPTLDPVANVSAGSVQSQNVTAQPVDLVTAREGQGVLDPTAALTKLLSGEVHNPFLQQQADVIARNVTRNTTENLLPQIRSGAVGAGGFGGSRQAIAEGLALSRAQQDIATGTAPLFGTAFENAQNRMQFTAQALNEQAFANAIGNEARRLGTETDNANRQVNVDTGNVNRELGAAEFNANLGINRNEQNLARGRQVANDRLTGANLSTQDRNRETEDFNTARDLLAAPAQAERDALDAFASIISPGAGLGGTKTSSTSGGSVLPQIAGGALLASQFLPSAATGATTAAAAATASEGVAASTAAAAATFETAAFTDFMAFLLL